MEYCVCGDSKELHKGTPFKPIGQKVGSEYCWYFNSCGCKCFKLDNLKLIEDLAKERKLV